MMNWKPLKDVRASKIWFLPNRQEWIDMCLEDLPVNKIRNDMIAKGFTINEGTILRFKLSVQTPEFLKYMTTDRMHKLIELQMQRVKELRAEELENGMKGRYKLEKNLEIATNMVAESSKIYLNLGIITPPVKKSVSYTADEAVVIDEERKKILALKKKVTNVGTAHPEYPA